MEKVKITKICQCCDRSFDFFLTVEQINKLYDGKLCIQQILPDLSHGDRELFISGICGECFDKIFLDSGEE